MHSKVAIPYPFILTESSPIDCLLVCIDTPIEHSAKVTILRILSLGSTHFLLEARCKVWLRWSSANFRRCFSYLAFLARTRGIEIKSDISGEPRVLMKRSFRERRTADSGNYLIAISASRITPRKVGKSAVKWIPGEENGTHGISVRQLPSYGRWPCLRCFFYSVFL